LNGFFGTTQPTENGHAIYSLGYEDTENSINLIAKVYN